MMADPPHMAASFEVISASKSKETLGEMKQSIVNFPKLTNKLNQAKRHCVSALDSFTYEMTTGIEHTYQVIHLMNKLINNQSKL